MLRAIVLAAVSVVVVYSRCSNPDGTDSQLFIKECGSELRFELFIHTQNAGGNILHVQNAKLYVPGMSTTEYPVSVTKNVELKVRNNSLLLICTIAVGKRHIRWHGNFVDSLRRRRRGAVGWHFGLQMAHDSHLWPNRQHQFSRVEPNQSW